MYKNKTFTAIIPARWGSVEVPLKNLRSVGNRTLVARSIDHAKSSSHIDHIVVSTDSEQIKAEAVCHGAQVVDRPKSLADSKAHLEDVMLHALLSFPCDYMILMHPTSPFRSQDLIDRCIRRIVEEDADSIVTGLKLHNFMFYQSERNGPWLSTLRKGTDVPFYMQRQNRQELDIDQWIYWECGNLYITRTSFLQESHCRLGGKLLVEEVSKLHAIQIDSQQDLYDCQLITNGAVL